MRKASMLLLFIVALLAACSGGKHATESTDTTAPPVAQQPPADPLPPPAVPIGVPLPPDRQEPTEPPEPPYVDSNGPLVCTSSEWNAGHCGNLPGPGDYRGSPGPGFFWVWDGTRYVLTPDPHYNPPDTDRCDNLQHDDPSCPAGPTTPPGPGTTPDTPPASPQAVTIDLRASSAVVQPGGVVVLSWTTTGNVDSCTLSSSRNFWPQQQLDAQGSYTTPGLPSTSQVTMSCKRRDMTEAQATRATLTLTVDDTPPGCSATPQGCEEPPLVFGARGTWETSGGWCSFTETKGHCVSDRAGQRAIFEMTLTAPDTFAGRSCYAAGSEPTGSYIAIADTRNAPIRISLNISPEWTFNDMRPANDWPSAPHCPEVTP
jgi:hypothetical protein